MVGKAFDCLNELTLTAILQIRYFEFEVLTAGPMRVGWGKADFKPGCQLGADDCSWAFDGYRVS
jgi:hypothetical protein